MGGMSAVLPSQALQRRGFDEEALGTSITRCESDILDLSESVDLIELPEEPAVRVAVKFEELYREYVQFVGRFLFCLGCPKEDVDDATQEVFLVAHRRPFKAEAHPRTWLAEIAKRVVANLRRSARRHRARLDAVIAAELYASANGQEVIEARSTLEQVESCLRDLDPDHREVFVLFELEDVSCAEIAAGLGIPVGTVYSRLNTARERFQLAWRSSQNVGGAA